MPKAICFTGATKAGRLVLDNQRAFDAALASWTDGPAVLKVERPTKKRSNQQNRFVHGCALPIFMEHFGYDRQDMRNDEIVRQVKHYLCGLFFGTETNKVGEKVPRLTTSQADTAQMTEFIDWLPRYGAEIGVRVPLPNDPMVDVVIEYYGVTK